MGTTLVEVDVEMARRIVREHEENSIRHYQISGAITFYFDLPAQPDSLILEQTVRDVDEKFPWRDLYDQGSIAHFRGDVCPSIKKISGSKIEDIQLFSFGRPERACSFVIQPGSFLVSRGQLLAYEKYLSKLAEELAKLRLVKVNRVGAEIQITRTTSFSIEESRVQCLSDPGPEVI